jgi:chromatin segregation and condensation protein Rec8/ScpA/Scc1 (kleisin family)
VNLRISPRLLSFPDFVKQLAKRLDVSEGSVEDLISSFQNKIKRNRPEVPAAMNREDRQEQLEDYLLSLIIQSPNWRGSLSDVSKTLSFKEDIKFVSIGKILEILEKNINGDKHG